ncbi:hypothetical protein P4S73_17045 [Paraglaciecola sp. Hal342]
MIAPNRLPIDADATSAPNHCKGGAELRQITPKANAKAIAENTHARAMTT